jgi:uncharacterized membrane protein YphA (DoxX/SURF4 family)
MTESLLSAIASGLALWPGLFLAAGGLAKAVDLVRDEVQDTVFARLLAGRAPLRAAWGLVAALELSVGVLVVAGLATPWPEAAAALLLSVAALIALWGLRHAPEAGCGCFGARTTEPVSARTAVRAGFLAALAFVAALGGASWTAVLDYPAAVAATVAAGLALAWLSPELPSVRNAAATWAGRAALPARGLRDAVCGRWIPVDRTVAGLRRSELWRRARPYVTTDAPTEHWDEGCWRLMCYPAVYEGESVTAVFSVHLGLRQSPNTVAFVDEVEQRVLGRFEAGRSES